MARRRRRAKIKISSLLALVVLSLLIVSDGESYHHHHNQHGHSQHQHRHHEYQQLEQASSLSKPHSVAGSTAARLCALLPGYLSKHLKLCKLVAHSPNANEAVELGAAKGLAECRSQFRSERWNCTHAHGDHHLLTGELAQSVGNRESGFVQAIAAAGIVHSIATACSVGNLSDCACDKTRIGLIRRQEENWKWGGCSNNIRHGMLFAKHLVELLNAVHQHLRAPLSGGQPHRQLAKRSLSSLHREPNLVRGRPPAESTAVQETGGLFCQRNQNLSQTAHVRLIRSLLSSNSLEKHQEFRLAINMHNNKVGRMAVAKTMELRCRCHGLSGSCSLKTCWLTLPSFQTVGNYLRLKYEGSIHLPSAVNVNKLIPMMDRDEISAILSGQSDEGAEQPESAALVAARLPPAAGPQLPPPPPAAAQNLSAPLNAPPSSHFNYYERHRQLLQASGPAPSPKPDELAAASIVPMTQQQYQALLRDMRLCNSSGNATASQLSTRDLGQQPAGPKRRPAQREQLQLSAGQNLKQASQHLSHLLQANKEDLIHLHRSPDYCDADPSHGYVGVQSRVCSDSPAAPDNCDKLCCGRGYTTRIYQHSFKCDCKFQYCCSIRCSVCEKEIKLLVCN